ncbi:MAG: hypothetical protein HYZ53_14590 [Planctomycetes bacterium]|nr:hypothetical protein [Planctomycetota bacterium]
MEKYLQPPPFVLQWASWIINRLQMDPGDQRSLAWMLYGGGLLVGLVVVRYTWGRLLRRVRILMGFPVAQAEATTTSTGFADWAVAGAVILVAYALVSTILG